MDPEDSEVLLQISVTNPGGGGVLFTDLQPILKESDIRTANGTLVLPSVKITYRNRDGKEYLSRFGIYEPVSGADLQVAHISYEWLTTPQPQPAALSPSPQALGQTIIAP